MLSPRRMLRAISHAQQLANRLKWTRRGQMQRLATVANAEESLRVGQKLHGFTVQRTKHIPELELTAVQLEHEKTGAHHLHLSRADSNNVFSIGFKTNPPDATGVPHILEHTTLCGSWKYPVRDPFFKMLPRSLSNFMNAFTSTDHTSYPFATTNRTDFRNLMSVYLDATLHPLLRYNDFVQEGWRIAPANGGKDGQSGNKTKSPFVFKGVVYNEMKGQMSDAGYLFYIRFMNHIFPAINNSGGDPVHMTELTYDGLKDFHAQNYHPSNARVFTYGDMPVQEHLEDLNAYFNDYTRTNPDVDIKRPINLNHGPVSVRVNGPLDSLVPQDMQHKSSVTWYMGDSSDLVENFACGILSSLLTDGYGSPMYRSLIESGLGVSYSPNTGHESLGKQMTFTLGLSGLKAEGVDALHSTIFSTLQEIRKTGFERSKVEGILHQLELALKHKTAQFGLGMMQRIEQGWFNDIDPFDLLAWNSMVQRFRDRDHAGDYLEKLLDKYLLSSNTFTFIMDPNPDYESEVATEEAVRLANIVADSSPLLGGQEHALQKFSEQEQTLTALQEQGRSQDLSCLPSLHIDDIKRVKPEKSLSHSAIAATRVQWRHAPTNGLTYFRGIHKFENLSQRLRKLIPLFTDAIMRLGTKDMSIEQLEERIRLKTGGINVGYHSSPAFNSLDNCEEGLAFSGFAFDGNVSDMLDLIRTSLLETNFDAQNARNGIRELLQASASGAVDTIAESGHIFACKSVESHLTRNGAFLNQTSGLAQIKMVTELARLSDDSNLDQVISDLKELQSIAVCNGGNLRLAVTCGSENAAEIENSLGRFVSSLPSETARTKTLNASQELTGGSKNTLFRFPYQIYYTSRGLRTVPYVDAQGPALAVLAQLLTHQYLHHEIREKGGAYGAGAYARGLDGVFGMYSYRDPTPLNSLDLMSSAGKWASDRAWTARELEEAKLSIFQSLDAPRSESEEGMTEFLTGVTHEMQQRRRELLLDVSAEQVKEVANQFLVQNAEKSHSVILGEANKENFDFEHWTLEDLGLKAPSEQQERS